jgi:hypothetical protein
MIYLSLSLLPLINEHLTIKFMYFFVKHPNIFKKKKTFHMIWKHVQLKSYAFFLFLRFDCLEGCVDGLAEASWWWRLRWCLGRHLLKYEHASSREPEEARQSKKDLASLERKVERVTTVRFGSERPWFWLMPESAPLRKYQFRGPRSPVPTPRTLTGTAACALNAECACLTVHS